MEKKYKLIIWVVIFLAVVFLIYYSITRPVSDLNSGATEALAKCLTEKGVYLHGAINCTGCEVQKQMFGDAASFLVYINCDTEPSKCIKGVALPYWNVGNATIRGPAPLAFLKDKFGC